MGLKTINPATGKLIKEYALMSNHDIQHTIEKAHQAFLSWRNLGFKDRATYINRFAELLKENKQACAELMTAEMGKPIKQAIAEVEKCAWICTHNATYAKQYLAPEIIETDMSKSMLCYEPKGVIFAIMPWNFPFWQVCRFAAPNLMAGNVGILSHAPISTGVALKIQALFQEAGLPEHVFTSVVIDNDQASDFIASPQIAGVTLTGSVRAGSAVAKQAGEHVKKSVLEMGGSDPYVILKDADIDEAVKVCVDTRMMNAGQVCISPKRVIVVSDIYDTFVEKAAERIKTFKPCDPMDESCTLGPMAREDLRDTLHKQVQDSIKAGAKCIVGGNKVEGDGFYYEPTLLTEITADMPAYKEELFGPVLVIIHAKDEEDALHIANDNLYGLGAAVFTHDIQRGEEIAIKHLEAGNVSVNTFVASDPRLPFGGTKQSGYGRECGEHGIREFVNIKTINIK